MDMDSFGVIVVFRPGKSQWLNGGGVPDTIPVTLECQIWRDVWYKTNKMNI